MTKYKVWVLAVGETTWATNGLEFETIAEADSWGYDLMMRWFGAEEYTILPVSPDNVGHLSESWIKLNEVTISGRSQS